MAVAPKNLVIPGKNHPKAHPGYATDMRTIEQWANSLRTGGGGITEITSMDGSVSITNPFGPVVVLSAASAGWPLFNGAGRATGPLRRLRLDDQRRHDQLHSFDGLTAGGINGPSRRTTERLGPRLRRLRSGAGIVLANSGK